MSVKSFRTSHQLNFMMMTANSCSKCLVNPAIQISVHCWFVSVLLLACLGWLQQCNKIKRLTVLLLSYVTLTTKIKQHDANR